MLAQNHSPGLWRQKRLVWLISWDFPCMDVTFDGRTIHCSPVPTFPGPRVRAVAAQGIFPGWKLPELGAGGL